MIDSQRAYRTKRTRASFPLVRNESTVPGIHHFDEQPDRVEAQEGLEHIMKGKC